MIGATGTMGNAMAYVGWAQAKSGSGGSIASRYSVWQLAGTYSMSKRTMLYGGFSEIDCNKQDNNVCSLVGENGGEDDKLSIGMKHTF
jgi:predicted porin